MKIKLTDIKDLNQLEIIYASCKADLENKGINQWTESYPSTEIIKLDIQKQYLYVLKENNNIIGVINISEEQEDEYKRNQWKFNTGKVLVIHRLVIDPKYQGNGFARKLMDFAEYYAEKNNYISIRLDAFSQNERVIRFYKKRNYFIRGEVNFPKRKQPFYCMEKEIKTI